MSVPEYAVREEYVGTGSVAAYTFDFKIASLSHLLIVQSTDLYVETFRVRGDDVVSLASVTFDAELGGGTVTLAANLPNTHHLAILLANDEPLQASEFKSKGDFTLARFESALDVLGGAIQRLAYLCKRSIKLPETFLDGIFETEMPTPVAGQLLAINATEDGLELVDSSSVAGPTGPAGADGADGLGVPVGGLIGEVLEKDSSTDGDATWKSFTYIGFSTTYGAVSLTGLKATIDYIMGMTRLAPTISLGMAGGSGTVREIGTSIASSLMTATVVKRSDPIAAVRFYHGASLISTDSSPNPAGGSGSTFNYATPFTTTQTFSAQVDDNGATGGPSTATSNTVTWTFIYPYYWGSAAVGRSAAQVAALTKVVATKPSALTFTAPGGEVFYVAILASQGAYTSIKDSLGFETINDWTRTTQNITGLDATAQSYYIYEFNNIVVAGSFAYTFS